MCIRDRGVARYAKVNLRVQILVVGDVTADDIERTAHVVAEGALDAHRGSTRGDRQIRTVRGDHAGRGSIASAEANLARAAIRLLSTIADRRRQIGLVVTLRLTVLRHGGGTAVRSCIRAECIADRTVFVLVHVIGRAGIGIALGSGKRIPRAERGRVCLLYTSPSPRDATLSRMPSSA